MTAVGFVVFDNAVVVEIPIENRTQIIGNSVVDPPRGKKDAAVERTK